MSNWPLLLGALFGVGVWLVVLGIRPARPSLAEELAELSHGAAVGGRDGRARPASRGVLRALAAALGGGEAADVLVGDSLRRDLAVLGRTPEDHVMRQVVCGLVAFVTVGGVGTLVWVAAGVPPLELPLGLALLVGMVAALIPRAIAHSRADRLRTEVRHAVTALVQGARLAMAAGSGVDEALHIAAGAWDGWVFLRIRTALDGARLHGETPWSGLARLGRDLGVVELQELAEIFGIAREEGARVRATLDARAASLQSHRLAAREETGHRNSVRMVIPVGLMAYAFMVLLVYPFVSAIVAGSP